MTCKDKCIQYETRLDMWGQARALECSTNWGCCWQNRDWMACQTSQNTFPICVHCKGNEGSGYAHIAKDEQFKMKAGGICTWRNMDNSKWELGQEINNHNESWGQIAEDQQFKTKAGACALNVKVWHVLAVAFSMWRLFRADPDLKARILIRNTVFRFKSKFKAFFLAKLTRY